MNVSHKVGWVWWASARCASRAVSDVLKFYEFYNFSRTPPTLVWEEPYSHDLSIPQGMKNYKVLMQVRNPYSRLLSFWHMYCFKNDGNGNLLVTQPFKEFAFSNHNLIADFSISIKKHTPNYLLRYEHLSYDISNIPFINLKDEQVLECYNRLILSNGYKDEGVSSEKGFLRRDSNNNEYADWKSYYSSDIAELVYTKYKDQFEAFKYERDSWKHM